MTLEIACRELIAFPQNQQTYPKSRNEDWKNDKKRTMQTSVETPSSHIKPTTCATNNSFQLHGQVLFSPFFLQVASCLKKVAPPRPSKLHAKASRGEDQQAPQDEEAPWSELAFAQRAQSALQCASFIDDESDEWMQKYWHERDWPEPLGCDMIASSANIVVRM